MTVAFLRATARYLSDLFCKIECILSFFKFRVPRRFDSAQAARCKNTGATLRHLRPAQKSAGIASVRRAKAVADSFRHDATSRDSSVGSHGRSDVNLSPQLTAVRQMIPDKPSHCRGAYGPTLLPRSAKTFSRAAALDIANLDRPAISVVVKRLADDPIVQCLGIDNDLCHGRLRLCAAPPQGASSPAQLRAS
jgi:hypothetical protein